MSVTTCECMITCVSVCEPVRMCLTMCICESVHSVTGMLKSESVHGNVCVCGGVCGSVRMFSEYRQGGVYLCLSALYVCVCLSVCRGVSVTD